MPFFMRNSRLAYLLPRENGRRTGAMPHGGRRHLRRRDPPPALPNRHRQQEQAEPLGRTRDVFTRLIVEMSAGGMSQRAIESTLEKARASL
jgi:hypothetical protein